MPIPVLCLLLAIGRAQKKGFFVLTEPPKSLDKKNGEKLRQKLKGSFRKGVRVPADAPGGGF